MENGKIVFFGLYSRDIYDLGLGILPQIMDAC